MPPRTRTVQMAQKVSHQIPTPSSLASGLVSGVVPNSDPTVAGFSDSRGKIMARDACVDASDGGPGKRNPQTKGKRGGLGWGGEGGLSI